MKRTANALLHALVIVPKVESSYLRSKARDFQDHFLALGCAFSRVTWLALLET